MTQPISVIARSLVRERQRTGLSLAEIAQRAGIAKSTLHNWKQGTATPAWRRYGRYASRSTFLCQAAGAAGTKTQVIRRGEGTKVVAEQAHYQAILLAACPPGARRDIYLLLTQPGADRISHPHPPGSVEHIVTQEKPSSA